MSLVPQRTSLPPIEALLPHRGGILLIDGVLECGDERVRTWCRVRRDAWYIDAGAMPAWIGLELMAQSIGAFVGFRKREQGLPPVQGYLLGTRRFRSARPAFAAGSTLEIVAERRYQESSGIGAFDCRIELDATAVAEATLTVFEPS